MSKHTPGPWHTTRDNFIKEWLISNDCRIVYGKNFDVAYCPPTDLDRGNANACLIAAAPDLLEACKAILSLETHEPSPAWDLIRSAIAKAEGK